MVSVNWGIRQTCLMVKEVRWGYARVLPFSVGHCVGVRSLLCVEEASVVRLFVGDPVTNSYDPFS